MLTSCSINVNINWGKTNENGTEIVDDSNSLLDENKINFIDGIYGTYGEDDGVMYQDIIEVFKGKDENYIDISVNVDGIISYYVKDLKITSNKNGEIIATKLIDFRDSVCEYFIENQYLEDAKLDVVIKDNTINLIFNKELEIMDKVVEKEKIDLKAITEGEKQKALYNIIDSNFKDINEDVFEIIHNTKNYLVVRVKSYIYWESPKGENYGEYGERGFWKNYYIEGSESVGMYKYYNIDKKNKKILELDNIITRLDDVNEYISKEIEKKYDTWLPDKTYWNEWEDKEFQGIGVPEVFENYFEIDEDKNIVKIRCLACPTIARNIMGDLCIDVPFSFFNLNQ